MKTPHTAQEKVNVVNHQKRLKGTYRDVKAVSCLFLWYLTLVCKILLINFEYSTIKHHCTTKPSWTFSFRLNPSWSLNAFPCDSVKLDKKKTRLRVESALSHKLVLCEFGRVTLLLPIIMENHGNFTLSSNKNKTKIATLSLVLFLSVTLNLIASLLMFCKRTR